MSSTERPKRSRLRSWLIALAVIGTLGIGLWQWGSYGPFEVTVNTPGRNLDQVVVRLARYRVYPSFHAGMRASYDQTRVGRSNEPIRFPRGFVCLCLRPDLSYGAWHPTFIDFTGTVPSRRFGISRSLPGRMNSLSGHATSGNQISGIIDTYIYMLEHYYVPHVKLPEPLLGEYMQQARDEISALPFPENRKAYELQELSRLETALREGAQR